jgi:hypothetical protein
LSAIRLLCSSGSCTVLNAARTASSVIGPVMVAPC